MQILFSKQNYDNITFSYSGLIFGRNLIFSNLSVQKNGKKVPTPGDSSQLKFHVQLIIPCKFLLTKCSKCQAQCLCKASCRQFERRPFCRTQVCKQCQKWKEGGGEGEGNIIKLTPH